MKTSGPTARQIKSLKPVVGHIQTTITGYKEGSVLPSSHFRHLHGGNKSEWQDWKVVSMPVSTKQVKLNQIDVAVTKRVTGEIPSLQLRISF